MFPYWIITKHLDVNRLQIGFADILNKTYLDIKSKNIYNELKLYIFGIDNGILLKLYLLCKCSINNILTVKISHTNIMHTHWAIFYINIFHFPTFSPEYQFLTFLWVVIFIQKEPPL